ncbi:MAG: ScyD/ScyE family protein [Actinobacteria bacterium]|nr:ScyD/ScyE family protein [Actinomycetota bacterium]
MAAASSPAFVGSALADAPTVPMVPLVRVVAEGLNGPLELQVGVGGFYVAEGADGEVTRVSPGGKLQTVLSGLPGISGVDVSGGKLLALLGGGGPPEEGPPPPPAAFPPASLLGAPLWGGTPRVMADLMGYELANNPDGQRQFDPETGMPNDALSNPFYVLARRGGGALVADGGANDVLFVKPNGEISTFFVPPTVNTGACEGRENNSPETPGCDAVPTGIAYGNDGALYVSALTGEVPGEGRVYKLNGRTGAVIDVISGFSAPTGVAVGPDGSIYVSELLHNAPAGEPPPDFDPSTVGRIVRVAPGGARTYASVTQPTGLVVHGGRLYSSAWALAGLFFGIPGVGQIVEVSPAAFLPPGP